MKKRSLISFVVCVAIYGLCVCLTIVSINIMVDASSVIRPQHNELAKLALAGNTVNVPENYNERVFQVCIVRNIDHVPETVVIGSSRGMNIGNVITGYTEIYNNCVSGGCIEDYYAILGLYLDRFNELPKRVVIEISPWIFYKDIPESRWKEDNTYRHAASIFYKRVNGNVLDLSSDNVENPYISLAYFQYNIEKWIEQGDSVFDKENATVWKDDTLQAELSDGTVRYAANKEYASDERTKSVKDSASGAFTYQNGDKMTKVDGSKAKEFESLVDYLQNAGVEVVFYLSPFSESQCKYSFDMNLNPGYSVAEEYVRSLAKEKGIVVHGGLDARTVGVKDEMFIDSVHLDKDGSQIAWNYANLD